ncbi:hypothetical protein VP1G_09324 [Cytospora mali]|uniref:Uncharacterized protein n=1 Tax=Cytospora mali TaxID=578113 RepID=A0A194VDZ3_CYTMA|nr:hypothetical protein VP1G_09324 [Valsa mali var. pyri (nom. inval.)]
MHAANLALTFHLLVEVPASLSFLLGARKQLREPNPSPEAVLICQSYGGLLLSTNVLCFLFLCYRGSNVDDATAIVAASLAIYHVFPMWRASMRIQRQGGLGRGWAQQAEVLGGPYVHFVVHVLVFLSLTWAGLQGMIY